MKLTNTQRVAIGVSIFSLLCLYVALFFLNAQNYRKRDGQYFEDLEKCKAKYCSNYCIDDLGECLEACRTDADESWRARNGI